MITNYELAKQIDQIAYDFDTYEYHDINGYTDEQRTNAIANIETNLDKYMAEAYATFLQDVIDETEDIELNERALNVLELLNDFEN